MARRNVGGRLVLLFLLHICVSAIPLTNPVTFFHNITISRFASQNVTSPGFSSNSLDYPIIGTHLVLRITETGELFTEATANRIIDRAISEVVMIINRGSGRDSLVHNRFGALNQEVELRIQSIPDKGFTYFMLGKPIPRRRLLLTDLPITSLTCALRDLIVIYSCSSASFPWAVDQILNHRRRCPCRSLAVYE